MKIEFSFYSVLFLTIISIINTGCIQSRISLVDQGVVSIETEPSDTVKILWSDVYQETKGVVVYGAVQQCDHTIAPLTTHLDITVLSTDGTILREVRTPDISLPRCTTGKGITWKRFKVRIPEVPQNSKITVVAHNGLHET